MENQGGTELLHFEKKTGMYYTSVGGAFLV